VRGHDRRSDRPALTLDLYRQRVSLDPARCIYILLNGFAAKQIAKPSAILCGGNQVGESSVFVANDGGDQPCA
jgi:hypothetical protein